MLLGHEKFGRTVDPFWRIYFPILILHTHLAIVTTGFWPYQFGDRVSPVSVQHLGMGRGEVVTKHCNL